MPNSTRSFMRASRWQRPAKNLTLLYRSSPYQTTRGSSDGSDPMAGLTVSATGGHTILYGTTAAGRATVFGTVFSFQP